MSEIVGVASNDLQQSILIDGVYEDDRTAALEAWYQALRNRNIFRARFRLKTVNNDLVSADVVKALMLT